jgi:hypothetical protein
MGGGRATGSEPKSLYACRAHMDRCVKAEVARKSSDGDIFGPRFIEHITCSGQASIDGCLPVAICREPAWSASCDGEFDVAKRAAMRHRAIRTGLHRRAAQRINAIDATVTVEVCWSRYASTAVTITATSMLRRYVETVDGWWSRPQPAIGRAIAAVPKDDNTSALALRGWLNSVVER